MQVKNTFTDVVIPIGTKDTNILVVGTVLHEEDLMADMLKGKIPGVRSIKKAAVICFAEREDLWSDWEAQYNNLLDLDRIDTAKSFFMIIKTKCWKVQKYCGQSILITIISCVRNRLWEINPSIKKCRMIQEAPMTTYLEIFKGRDAPSELVELADYVSDITARKHPMEKGIMAREGIEY